MKKTLSLILALLMSASCASYILADDAIVEEPVEETAVEEAVEETAAEETVADSKYGYAIEFLNHYKIYKGTSSDDLAADKEIERYQMALFVSRISTGWVDDEKWEDGPENWSEFTDINEAPAANYLGALSYANSKGIIEGYGDGKFGPYDKITYQNALTMVVRTLGYTGLDWPWGYIQKAVSLGLTDGITDVAYTDILTRGEVAQIIYNALFATTKDGTKLAMQSFGIEFGWEQAVIVASDLDTFIQDGDAKTMQYFDVEGGYGYYKDDSIRPNDDNNYYVEEGEDLKNGALVAFKILNEDGTLGDDLYYGYAKDFGLSGVNHAHDDEAVVGHSYYVLFEKYKGEDDVKTQLTGAARLNAKNENGGYVSIVDAIPLVRNVIENTGKLNLTEDDKYPIDAFLSSYTLVTKYSNDTYVNVTAKTKPELLVFDKTGTISAETTDKITFTIDWATGDILEPSKDKDGMYLDVDGKIIDEKDNKFDADKVAWTVKYYWNQIRKEYYEIVEDYDVKGEDEKVILGYKRVSDETIEKFLGDSKLTKKLTMDGFDTPITSKSFAKTAYATLTVFGYDANERAIVETYRLGYFKNTDEHCGTCGKTYDTWTLSDVDTYAKAVAAAKAAGETISDKKSIEIVPETAGCNHLLKGNGRGWFVEGYTPELALDKDGKETGKYADGYVIYSFDDETGAIKVVKNITEKSEDKNSFVTTGVLRAYNLKTGNVTIGDKTYSINKYDELAGNGMRYATKNTDTRKEFTEYFRGLFNQYVEYVVVDGELVHVARKGGTTNDVIVIDSYAGLSNDSYIVVNGYSTKTLKYEQFRIGSYNNWMKGDYYYYLNDKKAEESFSKGAIYAISSYDADEDVYYVQLAGEFDWDRTTTVDGKKIPLTYKVDSKYVDLANKVEITSFDEQNYFMEYKYTDGDKTKTTTVKMKDSDKYVIIPEITEKKPYAQIIVYEGKLGENWHVKGTRINSSAYVIVNATDIKGFQDTYKTGLVVLLDDKYTSLDYNGAQAEGWYLLGAAEGEVEVFDVLSGSNNVARATTNMDLKKGHVYFTQDDVIVEDLGEFMELVNIGRDAYPEAKEEYDRKDDKNNSTKSDKILDVAKYVFGTIKVTKDNAESFFKDGDTLTVKQFIEQAPNYGDEGSYDAKSLDGKLNFTRYYNIITDVKVFVVDYKKGVVEDIVKVDSLKKFINAAGIKEDTWVEYSFYAQYAYNCTDGHIVLYISKVESDATIVKVAENEKTNKVAIDRRPLKEDGERATDVDAYIEAQLVYDLYTEKDRNDKVTDMYAVIKGIELTYTGDSINGIKDKMDPATHKNIEENLWYFGEKGSCTAEANIGQYKITGKDGELYGQSELYAIYASIVEEVYAPCDEEGEECNLVKKIFIPFVAKDSDSYDVVINSRVDNITLKLNGSDDWGYTFGFDMWSSDADATIARKNPWSARLTNLNDDGKFEEGKEQELDRDVIFWIVENNAH